MSPTDALEVSRERTTGTRTSLQPGDGTERMLRRLVVLGTSLAVASIAVTFVVGILEGTVLPYDRLDPTSEASIFDWASAGATLIAAFLCAVHAIVSPRARGAFVGLGALALWASFDDSFVVHETIGQYLSDHSSLIGKFGPYIWTAVYAPLLAAIAYLLVLVVRDQRPDARKLVLAGLLCFAAAIGFEVMGGTPIGEPLPIIVGEEAIELGGWELVATGLTVLLAAALLWCERDPIPRATGSGTL